MYKLAKKAASREGFTLVELIVVIAILGILAGIAVPVYSGYISKANEAADQTLLAALNTAFAAACMEKGHYDMTKLVDELGYTPDIDISGNPEIKKPEEFDEAFQKYFTGNGKFKVFKSLSFNSSKGVFEGSETASDPAAALRASWEDSSFATLGTTEEVVTNIQTTFDFFGLLFGDFENQMSANNPAYQKLAGVLGILGVDDELIGTDGIVTSKATWDYLLSDEGLAAVQNSETFKDEYEKLLALREKVDNGETLTDSDYGTINSNLLSITKSNRVLEFFLTDAASHSTEDVMSALRIFEQCKTDDGIDWTAAAQALTEAGGNKGGISTLGAVFVMAMARDISGTYPEDIANGLLSDETFWSEYMKNGQAEKDISAYMDYMKVLKNMDLNVTEVGLFQNYINDIVKVLENSNP